MTRMLFTFILLSSLALQACATTDRLSQIGQTPPLSPIGDPAQIAGAQPMVMPMPAPQARPHQASLNSLWQNNSRTFFGDPRAQQVGDIVTISIDISDSAQVSNQTDRSRTNERDADLSSFFGWDLTGFFNDTTDGADLLSMGSTNTLQGSGSVNRREAISLTVAAIVTRVLPNGNLVLAGRQEVRVNNEVRELLISGIARPEDIASDNTLQHTQIAEARISYGGRGHISDMQRPSYGGEALDVLLPF